MKQLLLLIMAILSLLSCKKQSNNDVSNENNEVQSFTTVTVHPILADDSLSIRALTWVNDTLYFAANKGRYGSIVGDNVIRIKEYKRGDEITAETHFRSIASNGESIFRLSIASPAVLLKGDSLVHYDDREGIFYNSLKFWNREEGIAIGDAIDGCLAMLITRDGGETWKQESCHDIPKTAMGEAGFSASNTCIAIQGDHTWIATGGKVSNILYSANKGQDWEMMSTPIISGGEATGIYSVSFYDKKNGFVIGGDYTQPKQNLNNKAVTNDGGKSWDLVANGAEPGYRSCVQYVPNSEAKGLVAVGFEGIHYSNDGGENWKELSKEGFYTIQFINAYEAYAAGKGRIVRLVFNEKKRETTPSL